MSEKMWAGRTSGVTDKTADDFNSSVHIDCRMYEEDIKGSIAHAKMLGKCGIISADETEALTGGLSELLSDIKSGKTEIDMASEDIHMFVEATLTARIGEVGKKLHTARSRNDQVALDTRLYAMKKTDEIIAGVYDLISALCEKAEENKTAIMPGYTHLRRAQPVLFSHHLLAYTMMLLRDADRLSDAKKRTNVSPIGSCALAGTTYETDRFFEAELLGFDAVSENSMDGVSDRDFCVELVGAISILMMHLSRFSEEIILWSSGEFGFVALSDLYTTGSSIMPQKKNPDMAELVRGKTGRVYGDLVALLTVLKGIPLAYNKDMQEDKESLFDAVDTVLACLSVTVPMVKTMTVYPENMKKAAGEGFINATDLADYLVKKGMPFRSAYKIAGKIVARCSADEKVLETLPLSVYREYSELFDDDVYGEISLDTCVKKRNSYGGTSPSSVDTQFASVKEKIGKYLKEKSEL